MAVIPNAETSLFCTFLQTAYFIRLTPSRTVIVQTVKDASDAQTSVDDNTWNNFLLSTYHWYQAYLTDKQFNNTIGMASYAVVYNSATFAPADATTYYLGGLFQAAPSTGATRRTIAIPKTGTITNVAGYFDQAAGSAETSSLYIRVNDTTDYLVSSAIVNNAVTARFSIGALTIPVTAGDFIEIKWTTPTWVTNPTSVLSNGVILISTPN